MNGHALNATRLIETAEDLLSCRHPQAGPYWPAGTPGEREDALSPSRWDSFEYHLISAEGGRYHATTEETILKIDPDFRQKSLLAAIDEIVRFARLFLIDEIQPDAPLVLENVYLADDIRALCRRHLTRLLGRWYELEAAPEPPSAHGPAVTTENGQVMVKFYVDEGGAK